MRHALTLFELVMALVIIGVLMAVGTQSFHPQHLDNDTRYIKAHLLEAHYRGIGFDHRDGSGGEIADGSMIGCVLLTAEGLAQHPDDGKAPYALHAQLSGDLAGETLCFDRLGRPGLGDHHHLITETRHLTITYDDRQRTLSVYPYSGYVTIDY